MSGPFVEDPARRVYPEPGEVGTRIVTSGPSPVQDAPPGPPDGPRVVLPAGVVEALTLGPGDILVIRVPSHASSELFDQVAAQIAAGPLKGRVLLVAAEQIAAVRA